MRKRGKTAILEVLKTAIIGALVCALPYSKNIQATHFKFSILIEETYM